MPKRAKIPKAGDGGFSILAVLVLGVVVTATLLTVLQVSRLRSKTSAGSRSLRELDYLLAEAALVLQNGAQCGCNLTPAGAQPSTATATLSSHSFPVGSLRLFESGDCTKPVKSVAQVGGPILGSPNRVASLQLRNVVALSASTASGDLVVSVDNPGPGPAQVTRSLPLRFSASTAGASTVLTGCLALKSAGTELSCLTETVSRAGTGGAVEKIYCSSPTALMTAAQTILVPSNSVQCGSPVYREPSGQNYTISGRHCAYAAGQTYQTHYTCCEAL